MSPSLRLRTSVAAALRALSIFAPAIEPDVSTTRTTSIGGRLSERASGTSTHTPRNVSRVVLARRSPSAAAPIHVPLRFAVRVPVSRPASPAPSLAMAIASARSWSAAVVEAPWVGATGRGAPFAQPVPKTPVTKDKAPTKTMPSFRMPL